MRAFDPFRRAAVLALAWWLVGLGVDTDAAKQAGNPRRPAAAAEGWRGQPAAQQQAARLGTPRPVTSELNP
jgi:hypothetical protein